MVKCERCGTGFGPIQAAVLELCPRCKARDTVNVQLIVARVKEESPPEHEGELNTQPQTITKRS
jgi:uncharacterized OB-fold protein